MALPMATANAAPQTPAFVNMISLLLSSPAQPISPLANAAQTPVTTASPAQIADSMIRSMLGKRSSGSPSVSVLGSTVPGSGPLVGLPVAGDTRPQLATAASEQIADTTSQPTIQSTLSGQPSGSTVPSRSFSKDAGLPIAADPRKQLRSVTDLPLLPAVVAPMPTPAMAAHPADQFSPTPVSPSATITGASQFLARSPAPPVKSEIAFTAILTPIKDAIEPAGATDVARQIVAPPDTKTGTPDDSLSATTAPVAAAGNSSQTPTTLPVTEKDSSATHLGTDLQQGGDTPSQHHDDSTGTPAPANASAEAKMKPAPVRQDDNGAASAVQEREPGANVALAAFPDQPRVVATSQADTPATAPTPFHTTAETLRTSEPELAAAPQLRAGAAQEISIRIAQPDASTIDLRVVERSGLLHVDVRSSDAAMQSSLRQDLGTLANSLERAGYHSETFTPSSTLSRAVSNQQMANQDNRQDPSQNRGGSGEFSGGRRQQQHPKRPSTWLEEMEDQQ
jgi:hypothetical protein